jgi:PhoH-like ATPase
MVLDGLGTFEGVVVDIDDDVATVRILQNFYNSNNVWGVNARDELQNFALNLMPDASMDLITLAGPAGTGKTFLALACALHLVFQKKDYENIIITRETVAMGEEIGFLPGSEEEKMAPWMGAFLDNIEQLSGLGKGEKDQAGMDLIKNRLQMRSLGLMRGRSFSNSILIIDESQNLSPKQVKNLITRAGENTKIICLGNVAQIDTPYLSVGSTGLANLVQKFRQWPHAGHVTLRGVERSRLAAYAEEVL